MMPREILLCSWIVKRQKEERKKVINTKIKKEMKKLICNNLINTDVVS